MTEEANAVEAQEPETPEPKAIDPQETYKNWQSKILQL